MKQLMTLAANISDLERLVRLLKKAKDSYYNDGTFYRAEPREFPADLRPDGPQLITDKRYDKLEDALRERDPTNKLLRSVGTASRQKVKLPFYMGSLTKVRSESEIVDWSEEYPGPWVISDKIDGISILLSYKSDAVKLYTRGEATSGMDITHLAPHLKLPKLKGTFALRGELVMSKSRFDSKWAQAFKNPRNMAAGLANRKDVHDAVKDLTVMIYEVLVPRVKPSRALKWAKSKGFTVVPHKVVTDIDGDYLHQTFMRRRAAGKYEVDGLVLVQDQVHPLNKQPYPDWGRAFKSELADDVANATVKSVEWRPSRHGYLVPLIHVEPVKLKGVTVSKASGKNAGFIRDNKIGTGAVVRLRRSGDVIPDVKDGDVIKPARKAALPPATYRWHWDSGQVNIVLTSKTEQKNAPEIQVQVLEHFFKTLGVERIKAATLMLFVEQGYQNVIQVLRLSRRQFTNIEGGSAKVLDAVYDQLQERLAEVDLPTLMDASNVFGRGFGTRRCSAIVNALPNILKLSGREDLPQRIDEIEGFDLKTASGFAAKLPLFVKWLAKSGITPRGPKRVRPVGSKLDGHRVLFTGFRDSDLEKRIVANGGQIASGASKATILLAKDPGGNSAKLNAARQRGIKIMTADQFIRKYGI